jgi:hypothetical protein
MFIIRIQYGYEEHCVECWFASGRSIEVHDIVPADHTTNEDRY